MFSVLDSRRGRDDGSLLIGIKIKYKVREMSVK